MGKQLRAIQERFGTPDARREYAIAKRRSGWTFEQIGHDLGVTSERARQIVAKRSGRPGRPRARRRPGVRGRVGFAFSMARQPETLMQTSEAAGVPWPTIAGFERGNHRLNEAVVRRLLAVMGVRLKNIWPYPIELRTKERVARWAEELGWTPEWLFGELQ